MRRPLVAGLVALALVLVPAAAWAHVTISPGEAPKGGTDQEITLRVPNEDDTASTVKIEVKMPSDPPVLGVQIEDKPGWTTLWKTSKLAHPVTTDDGTITEAVSEIIWSKGNVAPGGYGDFRFLVGQLPDQGTQVVFKVIQTYSDGREVSWIDDPSPAGQPEPEHPAPVLTLVGAGGSTTAAPAPDSGPNAPTPTATAAAASKDDVDSAKTIALAGLAVGAIGLIVA